MCQSVRKAANGLSLLQMPHEGHKQLFKLNRCMESYTFITSTEPR